MMIKRTIVVMMAVGLCLAMAVPAGASDATPLVWGNPQIAKDMISGTANILIVGDSLQTNQRPANLQRWRPDNYGGITLAVDASGGTVGGVFSPWFTQDWIGDMTLRAPHDAAGPDGLTGISPGVTVHWTFDDIEVPSDGGNILNNRFLGTNMDPNDSTYHFGDVWTPNEDGDVIVDSFIYACPSGLSSGIIMEAWQGSDYYAAPLVSAPVNAYSATPGIQKLSVTFPAAEWDPTQPLRVQFRMVGGTTPVEGSTFTSLGTRYHTSTGMSFTSIARGGKGVGYFLDEYNCSDENLADYLDVAETNIAYIWLGANDPIEGWQESMEQLLARYKAARPDLQFVLISTYDLGGDKSEAMAEQLYDICSQRDDALFLNLFEAAGSYEFLGDSGYLGDRIHQNAAGAAYLADLLWGLITETAIARDSGDFDFDGDVDADDIDLFRYNFGNQMYDLDGDGDCDTDDMDVLIRGLVETSLGVGTEYGDSNLDGLVDKTDLTRLASYFGAGATWGEGDANNDGVIDTTDLTILAAYSGFDASADAIPEPATLFVMGCGAIGLLRRRRRA